MAATLITSYNLPDTGANSDPVTTSSFTPADGELIVVKGCASWYATNFGTGPSGGGLTWTKQVEVSPGGFSAYAVIWTAAVGTSPGSMTVSMTPSANSYHPCVVERWQGQLAATPATNTPVYDGNSAPDSTVTTTANGSVVTWCMSDIASVNPSTRAYRSSATEEFLHDKSVGTNGVYYFAYQTAAAAGAQSVGLTAPTGLNWSLAAIEIQDSSGGGGGGALPARPVVASWSAVQRATW